MKEMTEEEIWRAIRDLDPDHKPDQGTDASSSACVITVLALAVIACLVWSLLYCRGL